VTRLQRRGPDTGSATLLVVAVVVVLASIALAVGRFGGRLNDAARAQTAADAAALAGAVGGIERATELARANDAVLVAFVSRGDEVLVTVSVDGVQATARART
jgi:hypothetical protein